MCLTVKNRIENLEKQILSEFAQSSAGTKGRKLPDEVCPLRTVYQVDRGRIIHSKAFRRLNHKTQVFVAPEGDHYRTRLTHTIEVMQIAKNLARALRLNEDLTEAIALAHDLGHTPFGHIGEKALNEVSECGFKHNEQSLRVVDKLEKFNKGLNLTYEVRDGILNHTIKCSKEADTLEGQLVKIADRLAYINHDIDDAVRAKILSYSQLPVNVRNNLNLENGFKIDVFMDSLIKNSTNGTLKMAPDVESLFNELHCFMYEFVYTDSKAKKEDAKILDFIKFLYEYLIKREDRWPGDIKKIANEEGKHRAMCDYISGMTDRYAIKFFKSMFIPKSWCINGDF